VQSWLRQLLAAHYFHDDKEQWPKVHALGRTKLIERLSIFDRRLSDRPWIYGDKWSVIDGYIFWITIMAVNRGVDPAAVPHCVELAQRILSRPTLLAAINRMEQAERGMKRPERISYGRGGPDMRSTVEAFCETVNCPLPWSTIAPDIA
jgi:glutathione S-transferase